MPLTVATIQNAKTDKELLDQISKELEQRFSPDIQNDADRYLAALAAAPVGLRAMASVHPLDVSMALDDLAWHFGNQQDERLAQETLNGLKELAATEAAQIFSLALEIVRPFLPEIRNKDWERESFSDYLEETGIQGKIDPLNSRLWTICRRCGELGLMQYWAEYARKFPERCV